MAINNPENPDVLARYIYNVMMYVAGLSPTDKRTTRSVMQYHLGKAKTMPDRVFYKRALEIYAEIEAEDALENEVRVTHSGTVTGR